MLKAYSWSFLDNALGKVRRLSLDLSLEPPTLVVSDHFRCCHGHVAIVVSFKPKLGLISTYMKYPLVN